MAKRGGPRPGAGRPVGAVQRARPEQKKTLSDLAREHTADALNVLVLIATQGESEAARVSAANALLDRGYGKPQQSVEMSGPEGGPVEIDDRAAAARIAALLTAARSRRDDDGTEPE